MEGCIMAEPFFFDGSNVLALYKSLFFDLPLAGIRQAIDADAGKAAVEDAWKRYDEGVRIASAAIDSLYRNPAFGEALNRSLQELLRWQQLSSLAVGSLLPATPPTTDALTAQELRALLKELRTFSARQARLQEQQEQRDEKLAPVTAPAPPAAAQRSGVSEAEALPSEWEQCAECFEPVHDADPAPLRAASGEFSEYFEPVAYPTTSASGPSYKHVAFLHNGKTPSGAVKPLRPRQKHGPRRLPPKPQEDDHAVPA
jgi:hypothetical protein